jgi:DNA-binding HxlR family transcriptional regulator
VLGRDRRLSSVSIVVSSDFHSADTLDVIGDRWSLLVIRDLFRGKQRYSDFLGSSESIPTNLLADRLQRLVDTGIISAGPYSAHPPRMAYALTEKGKALGSVLLALRDWGQRYAVG